MTDACFHEILQRGRHGPARDHRPGPRQMAAPHGARLADRALPRLFAVTSIVCLAWPGPFVVGGALMVVAALLEALQGLTPDRTPNLLGAFWGAVGALAAALLAELFIRARRRPGHN